MSTLDLPPKSFEADSASVIARAARLVEDFRAKGQTYSGYPLVRRADCRNITETLRLMFARMCLSINAADIGIFDHFESVLTDFAMTEIQAYPGEVLRLRLLQADVKLFLDQPAEARRIIGDLAVRAYAIDADFDCVETLLWQYCETFLRTGEVARVTAVALPGLIMLTRARPLRAWRLSSRFASSLAAGHPTRIADGMIAHLAARVARLFLSKNSGTLIGSKICARIRRSIGVFLTGTLLFTITRVGDVRWSISTQDSAGFRVRRPTRQHVVTRAMGGIGDLLMMTPGLRALATKQKQPVKLAIPRKYFDVFANNPHVDLIDIDGPVFAPGDFHRWWNLTFCPAADYESRTYPAVRKGRVELFARGMGITRRNLQRHGDKIEIYLDGEQLAFRDAFLTDRRVGIRPLVGIQPYSRESYRDHPQMPSFITALARDCDVLVFHHVTAGVPSGPGIVSTAGLPLRNSLALVSAVDAMVTVDSAFYHAASAFDVPVVALFGPIDGHIRTLHVRKATVLSLGDRFPCAPCWRNEDTPCSLTGKLGTSPCVADIAQNAVMEAVAAALRNAGKWERDPADQTWRLRHPRSPAG